MKKLLEKLNKMTKEELQENINTLDKKLNTLNESLSYDEHRKLIREYNISYKLFVEKFNGGLKERDWE